MRKIKRWVVILMLVFLCLNLVSLMIFSAPTGNYKKLKVRALSDMFFGYLYPGSAPVTIKPDAPFSDTTPAEIMVEGESWMEYQVILPDQVYLKKGNDSIPVYNFTTDLPDNIGELNGLGMGIFNIGATIGTIPQNIREGSYSGKATITIYYVY